MNAKTRERWRAVRWPFLLTVGITVVLALRIADVWYALPDTVASHFGASGQPDAFMSKQGFFFFLAVIGWGTIALLFVVPLFLFRLPPAMISLPNREYWLASDERRVYALDRLAEYLGWTAAATAALLAVAIELAIRANLHETAFADGPFLVFLGAYFAFVLGATIWMLRTFSIGNLEASL